MKTWLRKLRGVVSIGALWGLASSVLGFVMGAIESILWPETMSVAVVEFMIILAIQYGIIGFVVGSGFAGVLTVVDGRKTIEELTPKRAALWGALTGVGLLAAVELLRLGLGGSIEVRQFVVCACVYPAVIAGFGAGTVSLARRAPAELEPGAEPHERTLLDDSGGSCARQIGPIWRNE